MICKNNADKFLISLMWWAKYRRPSVRTAAKRNFTYVTEWKIAFQIMCPCEVQILLSTRNLLIQLEYVYIYIITRLCILKQQCQLQEGLQTNYNFCIWTNKIHYFLLIYFNVKPLHVSSRLAAHQWAASLLKTCRGLPPK